MHGLLHRIKLLDDKEQFATTVIPLKNGMYKILERTEFYRVRYPATITSSEGITAYCEEYGLHRADMEQSALFE
ncbi:hypothetical protein BFS34_003050 [Macrococcoides caseolyticum subsp. hominis]|uniref:hypothetical protein n=1 Tax=Macrococcoides caseolyticum TaxID=69966 RepID=UPI000C157212|nr:hypothetical protein [Macrococcus caseolyticus]RAI81995.1 hypothetical protein BFS34_003050 [Macrococcus caseolyticus subsp. hominis]